MLSALIAAYRTIVFTCFIFAFSIAPAEAGTFFIHDGPEPGMIAVTTSWGDYVAYDTGGGEWWVGPRKEYERDRAIGIFEQHNSRLSSLKLDPQSTAEFVEAHTFRTRVGSDIGLDEIVPEIAFDDPVSGHGAATYHTLSVTWIQNSSVPVYCTVFDPKPVFDSKHRKGHYSYQGGPEDVNNEWRNIVVGLPNDFFRRPLVLVFVAENRKPSLITIPSVTQAQYEYLKGRLSDVPSDDDQKIMQKLLKFDPSLEGHSKTVLIKRSVFSAQNPAFLPQSKTKAFSGSIHDDIAGNGTIEMQIISNHTGNLVGGTWSATFSNPSENNNGNITPINSYENFYLESQSCRYQVSTRTMIGGGYFAQYAGCNNHGTFYVTQDDPNDQ